MPDTKITALTALTAADPANDVLPIVDVSDTTMAASGTTKKISINNVLGCSGTATLASATITGNLTVQTNKLFVNASGAAVGTTSIFADFQVQRSTNARLEIDSAAASLSYQVLDNARTGYLQHNVYASQHLWFNGVTEAMRLNSTGLGVGVTPSGGNRLMIQNTTDCTVVFKSSAANVNSAIDYVSNYGNYTIRKSGTAVWDYGVINDSSATPAFKFSNGTDRLVIDSSGNVGIGVTPSAWGANYKAFQIGAQSCLYNALGYITSLNTNAYENSSGQIVRIANGEGTRYVQAGGSHQWFYASNASAGTVGGFTQAMTLDASGNLLVGQTTAGLDAQGGFYFRNAAASGGSSMIVNHRSAVTGGNSYAEFTYNGVGIGSITQSGTTGVAFNATSDYRLKEAVQPITGALNRIAALKPSIYKWKTDGSNGEGFLAHELAEAVPLAVTGEKDAVNEDGSIKPQQVDLSKVVPVLVAAIQELAARVQTLETR